MPDMNKTMPVINQYTVADCKNITPLCPVDQTIYGYYPNLGANAFFLALFAILCAVNIAQGIKYKTWTYMIAHRGYWLRRQNLLSDHRVYRIAELGPGWRNKIMQNENEFIVLDSVMVAIATVFLTIFHPGYVFPKMQMHKNNLPTGATAVEKFTSTSDLESTPPNGEAGERKGYFGSK